MGLSTLNRFNLFLPEHQTQAFNRLSEQTKLSVAELMRRIFDQALNAEALNNLVPAMSGQLQLAERAEK